MPTALKRSCARASCVANHAREPHSHNSTLLRIPAVSCRFTPFHNVSISCLYQMKRKIRVVTIRCRFTPFHNVSISCLYQMIANSERWQSDGGTTSVKAKSLLNCPFAALSITGSTNRKALPRCSHCSLSTRCSRRLRPPQGWCEHRTANG